MARRRSARLGSILSVMFTSLVAPVLVHFLLDPPRLRERPREPAERVTVWSARFPPASPGTEVCLIAAGEGPTAQAAREDAVNNALGAEGASLVDAPTWQRQSKSICAALAADAKTLVVRSQDLECTFDRGLWRRKLAVVVDRDKLASKLRDMHLLVVRDF